MRKHTRALIVDDEKVIRDLIRDILGGEGPAVGVAAAGTCREALREVRHQRFDVIFLDVCLKDGNGVELLRRIRRVTPDARIYMMTGFSVAEQIEAALAGGASGAIYKPFRVNEIVAAVRGAAC